METPTQRDATLFAALATRSGLLITLASFVVYLLGYLALRFQLTALGVGTDLHLLDERYLFEGAKFLVYLCATVPLVVLVGLLLAPFAWLAARARPSLATLGRLVARTKPSVAPAAPAPPPRHEMDIGGLIVMVAPPTRSAPAAPWQARSALTLTAAVAIAVLMIQLVMRQCFAFDNLLLRDELPPPAWFAAILTASSDMPGQIYFALLLAGILALATLLYAVGPWRDLAPAPRGLAMLLAALLGIQALLLPVNYGFVIAGRGMPRLAANSQALNALGQPAPASPAKGRPASRIAAWLIWEGTTGMTFLVQEPQTARKLVTVPRDKLSSVEIVAYDPLAVLRSPAPDRDAPGGDAPERDRGARNARESSSTLAKWAAMVVGPSTREVRSGAEPRGNIFVVSAQGGKAQPLTEDSGYHSPLFFPDDYSVLALRDEGAGGNRLVRIYLRGGAPEAIATLQGAHRLVGFDTENPAALFLLADVDGQGLRGMSFDLQAKGMSTITAPAGEEDKANLARLRGDVRERGNLRLFVVEEGLETLWTDIFFKRGSEPEINLTKNSGAHNRQPALSNDGRWVAFVRVDKSL